jgi:hypothetical protein
MITAIVTGSRDWNGDYLSMLIETALSQTGCGRVVQGGCPKGADKIARKWAIENNMISQTFTAKWYAFGRAAGPIRNKEMMEAYKDDPEAVVLAFRLNNSRGTTSAIEIARSLNMNVYVKDVVK